MSNLFVITGARGTGKSSLAATRLPPSQVSKMFVHDSEKSMNRVIENLSEASLSFGYYGDLNARFSDLPSTDDLLDRINRGELPWVGRAQKSSLVAYYEHILSDLAANLTPNKYSVYIHDTIEKLEAGMAAWVEEHRKIAGVSSTAYGGLWTQGVYPLYEHFVASIFGRGVDTIILTSHLKTPWQDKRPVVGKVAPAGKKLLYKLSSLFIWLVSERSNEDGAPAGLVLKERLGKLTIGDNDRWVIKRMLPERIPHCTWEDIDRYLEVGCNLSNPAPGESLTPAERSMISELVSDEQMRLMVLGAEKDLAEMQAGMLVNSVVEGNGAFDINAAAEEATLDPLTQQVRMLHGDGVPLVEIAKTVGKPLPFVIKVLSG